MEEDIHKITFDTNAKQVANETNKLGASIEHTTNATAKNNNAVEQGNETYKNFRLQLREANDELQKQIQLTGESSQETIKAAKAVADLKDQIGFATDIADSFNPDQKMKALGAATRLAATGVQGVTAGMALFGDQSEDTQKTLLKVQAAMAFSDAISGLSDLGDQWALLKNTINSSSIATKANAAATGLAAMVQNLFTGSVNTSSAGFKGLKLAIAGTGIGLLVVGLALVVTNFSKIKEAILNVVPGLASVGKFIGKIIDSVTDFIGVTSEADRAADRLKANAEKRSKDIDRILKEDGSRYSESAKKKMAIDKQLQEDIAEGLYNEQKLRKEAAFAVSEIDRENAENTRKKAQENAEKLASANDAINEKARVKRETAEKTEADRLQKIADEKLALEMKSAQDAVAIIEQLKENIESPAQKEQREFEEKREILLANNLSIEELTVQHIDKLGEIEKAGADKIAEDKRIKSEKEAAEQKIVDDAIVAQKAYLENSKAKATDAAIGFLSQIAGKNKTLQRAAIIAESAIGIGRTLIANAAGNATAAAVAAPLLVNPVTAIPAAASLAAATLNNNIATGLGVAGNVAATAKALQALGGGGGPSAGSVANAGPRGSAPPSVAFNNTAENQIGQSVARTQADSPPMQVVVLESDISKAQNSVKVLVNKNTF